MKYEHDAALVRKYEGSFERFWFQLCVDGDLHAFRETPLPFATARLPLCGKLVDVDPSWEGDAHANADNPARQPRHGGPPN